ncbi:phage antirepressor KilAC domain-containing protein [Brachybacterium sp. UMB0905]|uniref:phage antirepressor KilAC domain-containing protein n=1 Tax=Brachybacterium sp. UMB0905 TaxID=2069310 RepID=UPI000C81068B|nr:phage antirepressor KilAC domain-containing protein [Brachybacterium sp. UMB0905]PMC76369.1 phage antirepressor protein [Brachybacterium sp. UMB0905]
MHELTPFAYEGHNVRTITDDHGEPWFVLADVGLVLGTRGRDLARMLDPEDRGAHVVRTPSGEQQMTTVNEAGLYTVLLRSNNPSAKPFRRWVTTEVLPTIRKTGTYGTPRELTGPELLARAVLEANRTIKALEATVAEQQPKADAWDQIVSSAGSWSYEEAAKVLFEQGVISIGQKRLVRLLVDWGYLYRDAKRRPHAYQRYIEQGLFVTKARIFTDQTTGERRESSAPQVRITGKGLDMLFRRFRTGQLEVAA